MRSADPRRFKPVSATATEPLHLLAATTNAASTMPMRPVRVHVAMSESTPRVLIFAKMTVSAAEHADSNARWNQSMAMFILQPLT